MLLVGWRAMRKLDVLGRAISTRRAPTPLTELLGDWVFTFILGTLAAISCAWVPAHDDLIRRKDEPFYQGVHVRRIILICRLFSISLLRATPPPRPLHR